MDTQNTFPQTQTYRFPIFRAGTHTSADGRLATITVSDLEEIAQSYDAEFAGAPLVVGHPQLDAPAYGWVKSLSVNGDELIAEVDHVEMQFAEMVNAKRFPNRSAGIYLANTPGNPKPGKKYLQHIGFLGAAAPAVKGLRPIQFSSENQALYFNEPLIPKEPSTMDKTPEQIKHEADLAAREAAVAQAEAKIEAHEAQIKRANALQFAENLAKEGKLLPNEIAPITELLLVLPDAQPLQFSEAGSQVSKSADDVLRGVLSALPNRIEYGEKSASTDIETPLQFSAPVGTQVDQSQADIFRKATQYKNANPAVDWITAVQAVGG
ncbi:hypothetical protein [Oligella urethralis]|uniref:hypothetical protein n=1 Tax=Oligella urethralis TaxID=90245 RepID=UPI00288BD286|nr:hypothetical protein [Oligella urethralis]